jgi:hypothetical protein
MRYFGYALDSGATGRDYPADGECWCTWDTARSPQFTLGFMLQMFRDVCEQCPLSDVVLFREDGEVVAERRVMLDTSKTFRNAKALAALAAGEPEDVLVKLND